MSDADVRRAHEAERHALEESLETYKRATTATLRAIAENDELEVTYGKGAAGLRGTSMHVPLPNAGCSEQELNAVRGIGDEFALKMRYHDDAVHRSSTPRAGPAQEMFEWVEDARVASIGSLRMEGGRQKPRSVLGGGVQAGRLRHGHR